MTTITKSVTWVSTPNVARNVRGDQRRITLNPSLVMAEPGLRRCERFEISASPRNRINNKRRRVTRVGFCAKSPQAALNRKKTSVCLSCAAGFRVSSGEREVGKPRHLRHVCLRHRPRMQRRTQNSRFTSLCRLAQRRTMENRSRLLTADALDVLVLVFEFSTKNKSNINGESTLNALAQLISESSRLSRAIIEKKSVMASVLNVIFSNLRFENRRRHRL